MKVVITSDLHIEGPDDPVQDRFVRWLDERDPSLLVLLGDVFHAWWGFPAVVQSRYLPACAALQRFRRRGGSLVYVPGNHDFALGSWIRDDLGAEVRGPHVRRVGSLRVFLAHGDEADPTLRYRLARRLLRGPAFAAVLRALGPGFGERLLFSLAGASRAHTAGNDLRLVRQRAWAREQMRDCADVAVLGHLHWRGVIDMPEGRVYHLGDWRGGDTWVEIDAARARLLWKAKGAEAVEVHPEGG